jgi:hypothetical protein
MTERPTKPGGTDFEYYKAVCRTSELTARQKLVAVIIRNHWSPAEKFNPSNATIAKQAACGKRQVQRELAVLKRLGWLQEQRRTGTTTVWTPRIPVGYADVRDPPTAAASPPADRTAVERDTPPQTSAPADAGDKNPRRKIRIAPTAVSSTSSEEGATRDTPVSKVTPAAGLINDPSVAPVVSSPTSPHDTDDTPGDVIGTIHTDLTHTDPTTKEATDQRSLDPVKGHDDVSIVEEFYDEESNRAMYGESPFRDLAPEDFLAQWPFTGHENQMMPTFEHYRLPELHFPEPFLRMDLSDYETRARWMSYLLDQPWIPILLTGSDRDTVVLCLMERNLGYSDYNTRDIRVRHEAVFRCACEYVRRGFRPDEAVRRACEALGINVSGDS